MEGFVDIVQKWFAFLVENEGFTCQVTGERRVIYSNSVAIIRVGLGERGDVGITVDKNSASCFYPFSFYLKTFFPDEAARLEDSEAKSRLELDLSVMKLANLLKHFGRPLIDGDPKIFHRMATEESESL